jgi:hypothetical protein
MLTRSPVQPSPANASSPRSSFHVFHYAPATSSPHHSPSARAVAAGASPLHRRKSSSSLSGTGSSSAALTASPSICPPPPKRYVGVDASTQYSPMDDSPSEAVAAAMEPAEVSAIQSATDSGREMPPTPEPKQKPLPDEQSSEPAKAVPSASSTGPASALVATPGASTTVTQAISPNKRRNSESQREGASASASIVTGSPKRARAEAAPPKILPQKYEFCRVEDIVILIANMLCELIETNDALALKSGHLTRFHSR